MRQMVAELYTSPDQWPGSTEEGDFAVIEDL